MNIKIEKIYTLVFSNHLIITFIHTYVQHRSIGKSNMLKNETISNGDKSSDESNKESNEESNEEHNDECKDESIDNVIHNKMNTKPEIKNNEQSAMKLKRNKTLRLSNFAKYPSKCHPSQNNQKKSGKCFYCERFRHIYAPKSKRSFKVFPKICEGCNDTQIYEYWNQELKAFCYAYCSPHCNQCIRRKNKRNGKLCSKEMTMENIGSKKKNETFDEILLSRLKVHVADYLSKLGAQLSFSSDCFYCGQGNSLYNDILYEQKRLSFCDKRLGSIYSYTNEPKQGGKTDRNKYYAYYSKECKECVKDKNERMVDHEYVINMSQQDEAIIKENEKNMTRIQRKQKREVEGKEEYIHITAFLEKHRVAHKNFSSHEYDCDGNPNNKKKIEMHNAIIKQSSNREMYCNNDYPILINTDYPINSGHEFVIPKICYYCDKNRLDKTCNGCLASMYIYIQ
jgi:hypothetical protein